MMGSDFRAEKAAGDGAVTLRCAPWLSWVDSDDAITLFDDRDGSYHALNPSAAAIWQAFSDGARPGDVAERLAAAHPAAAEAVRRDVAELVAEALQKGLLVPE